MSTGDLEISLSTFSLWSALTEIILFPLIILNESPSALDDLIAFDAANLAESINILSSLTSETYRTFLNFLPFKNLSLIFIIRKLNKKT